jgi:hypothetical protein
MVTTAGLAEAQSTVPVTVNNFVRAETDNYIANTAKEAGGLGKFSHNREPASIDNQTVIRLNRDTLYSFGVFDLAAGPVMISLPDAGKRFMSLMVILSFERVRRGWPARWQFRRFVRLPDVEELRAAEILNYDYGITAGITATVYSIPN